MVKRTDFGKSFWVQIIALIITLGIFLLVQAGTVKEDIKDNTAATMLNSREISHNSERLSKLEEIIMPKLDSILVRQARLEERLNK